MKLGPFYNIPHTTTKYNQYKIFISFIFYNSGDISGCTEKTPKSAVRVPTFVIASRQCNFISAVHFERKIIFETSSITIANLK